jgi:5'-methylthioadenosine phosphorylase
VTVAEVVKTLHTNAGHARAVAEGLLQKVVDHVAASKLDQVKGSMQWSCVTAKDVSKKSRRDGLIL